MESLRVIDIQKIVDAAIERRNQVRAGGRDKDYFHVSDAGTCYRKRYLKRLGVEPQVPIPTASLRKMYAGDAGHVALQELLKWDNSLFASEGNLGDGQHILGLDQMTVAYFKREDFGGVQFDYQWQDEVREEVSREWLPLLKAWAAKVLPACTCNLDYGGAGVNYCRYQDGQGGCCSEDLLKTLVTETKGDK
jgi:hypothetical protein